MKVYISGMITGLAPDEAEENFRNAESKIRKLGWQPVNPYEEGKKLIEPTYEDYLQNGIRLMRDCSMVLFLDNWQYSKGAVLEEHYARLCHKHLLFEKTLDVFNKDVAKELLVN